MEFVTLLLLFAILILIVSLHTRVSERIQRLETEIRHLREQIARSAFFTSPGEAVRSSQPPVPGNISSPAQQLSQREQSAVPASTSLPSSEPANYPLKPPQKPSPANRDLEKFIGENLVSKIGIAVLVLAIGFFVKYAIDNEWIKPAGRVGVGLLCGAILTGVAHYLRNSYKAFSSVLLGGALATFYFTIALGYHQYGLFSQAVAFVIMVMITSFAVVLSILYNRQELAVIALVGGFATPFMVSDGSGDYITLFIYLIILNLGLLVLAFKKSWRVLNLLAFLFTVIIFGGWSATLSYNEAAVTYRNALLFATIFFLLFFTINIIRTIRENKKFTDGDLGILITNTGLYFITGLYCLAEIYAEEFRGLFCIGLAAFHLVLSGILLNKNKTDARIIHLLLGTAFILVALAAPIQLITNNASQQHAYKWHYALHWIMAVSAGIVLYRLLVSAKKERIVFTWPVTLTWILCFLLVVFITAEIHLIINAAFHARTDTINDIRRIFIKTGWPIIWGLCSFVFMWLGMKYKFRTLRIVSLTLFCIILIKLFLYDIRNISATGKIAAFFSLGILLLVVSFMYQRLKKIIIDNEKETIS